MPKKEEAKKVMKKKEAKIKMNPHSDKLARKMCNSILTKVKGLTLVENKHGAVQIKRSGDLMFSFRSDGKCIVTHPIFTGEGKKKERFFKHIGSQYDHLTNAPWADVTTEMLVARCKDSKSASDYHKEFYSGKNKEASGLFIKAQQAKAKTDKAKKETGKLKRTKKKESKSAKNAKNTVARKKTTKKTSAIKKVAKATA